MSEFAWPCSGWALATGQYLDGLPHGMGTVDISAPYWSPVYAARSGVVATVSNFVYNGAWTVFIDHGFGFMTMYAHFIQQPGVIEGHPITAGDLIGYVGRTGLASNPHCHFGVIKGGEALSVPGLRFGDPVQAGVGLPWDFGFTGGQSFGFSTFRRVQVAGTQPIYDLWTYDRKGYLTEGTYLTSRLEWRGLLLIEYPENGQRYWMARSSVRPVIGGYAQVSPPPPFSAAIATYGVPVYQNGEVVKYMSITDKRMAEPGYNFINIEDEEGGYYKVSGADGWIPGFMTTGPR